MELIRIFFQIQKYIKLDEIKNYGEKRNFQFSLLEKTGRQINHLKKRTQNSVTYVIFTKVNDP